MMLLSAYTPRLPGHIYCEDALSLLRALPDCSVDAVITDPPYSSSELEWDLPFDLSAFWGEVFRVLTPTGVCGLFSSMKLAAALIYSQPERFKYEWIWLKDNPVGAQLAHYRPMKINEYFLIFSKGDATPNQFRDDKITYNAQGVKYEPLLQDGRRKRKTATNTARGLKVHLREYTNWPQSIIYWPHDDQIREHPTQKPVGLCEYFINTYSNPNDLILDPFAGSGTTLVAARNTGRHYIGGDITQIYVETARKRLAAPYTPPLFAEPVAREPLPTQEPMFEER